jgi:hypothetical protein
MYFDQIALESVIQRKTEVKEGGEDVVAMSVVRLLPLKQQQLHTVISHERRRPELHNLLYRPFARQTHTNIAQILSVVQECRGMATAISCQRAKSTLSCHISIPRCLLAFASGSETKSRADWSDVWPVSMVPHIFPERRRSRCRQTRSLSGRSI